MGAKKKLITLACSTLLVTAGVGMSFADTYKTIDGHVLTTPAGISVFSAKEVQTKAGVKNLFSPETIKALNTGIEKGVNQAGKNGSFEGVYDQELAENNKETNPLTAPKPKAFSEFKGELVKDINFQELKGNDADGHHVAYVFEVTVPKEGLNAFYKSMGVEESYDYSNLTEKDVGAIEAKKNKPVTKVDIAKLNKEIKENQIKALAYQEVRMPNGQTRPLSESEKLILKEYINLITYEPRDEVLYANIKSEVGEVSYYEGRLNTKVESMSFPLSVINIVQYKPEGLSSTFIMMNDNSFDYWKQQVATIWNLKK